MIRILRNTWRNTRKQRITSSINMMGLAIGIASAVMIFLWVQNELSYDNYHADKHRIYRTKSFLEINKGETWTWETGPLMLGEEIRKQLPGVEDATRMLPVYWAPLSLNLGHRQFAEMGCAYVDERWFNIFHYDFLQGNAKTFNKDAFSLILTESKAKKFFGHEAAVGKTIRIDTVNYTVQAVVADNPVNSTFQFEVLIPIAARLSNPITAKDEANWANFNYHTFVKLSPTANTKDITAKINSLAQGFRKNEQLKLTLLPLSDMHFEDDLQFSYRQTGNRKTVYIFMVLGFLILLIACINYVNLTTARASLRLKEVSIKKIVGAERSHLMMQFMGESALMTLVSLLVGLVLVVILLPLFNQVTEKQFELNFSDPGLWYILGAALVTTILLTSIYPAVLLSSFRPVEIFRGKGFLQVKDSLLRKGLVVIQFTFSIALIIGVLVIAKQLNYMQEQDNGYARSQVMSFILPYNLLGNQEKRLNAIKDMKTQLLANSSIEAVGLTNQNTIQDMKGLSSGSADWEGRHPDFKPSIAHFTADDDFIKVVKLDIIKGKWFEPGANNDIRNVIVNETAVKELKLLQPVVGQRFKAWGDSGMIIGVVKDFHYRSMHDKIGPLVIKKSSRNLSTLLVKSGPGQMKAAAGAAEKIWKQHFPSAPVSFNFLDEEFDKLYKADQKASILARLFAGMAIIISCLGLFGLAAFTAQRRTKEIGIRKVLGAGLTGIIHLLSKEFVLLVAIAFVLASPVAWFGMKSWLQDFAYRAELSWWIFALAGILSIMIALLTVCFHAIRAALSNPVKSLRTD